ncbi:hypothetical protein TrRE_jg8344, partial [Triparma retinervis]
MWSEFDKTGEYVVVRKGNRVFRVKAGMGSKTSKTVRSSHPNSPAKKTIKAKAKTKLVEEDEITDIATREFTKLDLHNYRSYNRLLQVTSNPITMQHVGKAATKKLAKLENAVLKEAKTVIARERDDSTRTRNLYTTETPEAVWIARREKKRLNQIAKEEEKKEMLENIRKVHQKQAGNDAKKRAIEFEKYRRQSMATAAPHRKTEQEKRKELLHDSIMNCTTCRMSIMYCPKCRVEVEAFFDSFPALAEKYQARANEIFIRIKRALDDKHYVIGSESDELVSTRDILEVTRYLKNEDERTRRWLQRRGRAFRAREKHFKEKLLENEIYHDIDVQEHSEGINMFRDKKVVDPVFEDNIITRYATSNAIKELYIPEEMQHPWSGDGDAK